MAASQKDKEFVRDLLYRVHARKEKGIKRDAAAKEIMRHCSCAFNTAEQKFRDSVHRLICEDGYIILSDHLWGFFIANSEEDFERGQIHQRILRKGAKSQLKMTNMIDKNILKWRTKRKTDLKQKKHLPLKENI